MHYQIIEMLGEGGMRPNRCWCSPSGDPIAPDNARSLPLCALQPAAVKRILNEGSATRKEPT